ncbi:MAG: HAMP domain-containing histidine kinase [Propionibacteriaceae bacterium]|jgi:signal transduction histidine kinase|nr:HAMP domain-containing histidine kinase [Propionibacteriaceae bacterium]
MTETATADLRSLRTRILVVFLGLLFVVFVAISVVFNVLVNQYVSQTATTQLSTIVERHTGSASSVPAIPDVSDAVPSPLNTRPAVFLMTSAYAVGTSADASAADLKTARQIAAALEALGPGEVNNWQINTTGGSYYVSSVPNDDGTAYLVFYVDVTGIVALAATVNLRLIFVMLAATVIAVVATVIITRRMTRPLATLTAFSQRIGQGDFTPCTDRFHDRELATLAASLNQTAGQLESYDRDQKTFFQNASHELRTPLMSITCYAEGIAYGVMEPGPASQTILSETTRLTGMVEDLLTVSRIDSLTRTPPLEVCDAGALLAQEAAEQRPLAESRGLALVVTTDPAPLTGSDRLLRWAFANLISNALRYAEHRIELACHTEDDEVVVTVADDGPGIAEEDRPYIFDRFYKGTGGKHGIGLAIVKSVVEQHLGHIEVTSGDPGATFRLTFPRRGT